MGNEYNPGVLVLTHKTSGYFLICATRNMETRLALHMDALRWRTHSNHKFMQGFKWLEDVVVKQHRTATLKEAHLKAAQMLAEVGKHRLCCNIAFDGWAGQLPTELSRFLCNANPGREFKHYPKPVVEQRLESRSKRNPPASFARHCTPVSIKGVIYSSISQAMRMLLLKRNEITRRLYSEDPRFQEWTIVNKQNHTL